MSSAPAAALSTAIIEAAPTETSQSQQRLLRVKELWTRSQKDQLELGRLLYEERGERLGVGGQGNREGFHQWLRDAGIPKNSAYRRIAEYEISIGERSEDEPFDKPVPNGTSKTTFPVLHEVRDVEPTPRTYPQEDYAPEQQVKAAASRSHGMGLERLRKLSEQLDVACTVSHDGEAFRVSLKFTTEKEATEFLKGFASKGLHE
jgi:hypothetical protein